MAHWDVGESATLKNAGWAYHHFVTRYYFVQSVGRRCASNTFTRSPTVGGVNFHRHPEVTPLHIYCNPPLITTTASFEDPGDNFLPRRNSAARKTLSQGFETGFFSSPRSGDLLGNYQARNRGLEVTSPAPIFIHVAKG